jgi:tyrosyl-tRNA synthetase
MNTISLNDLEDNTLGSVVEYMILYDIVNVLVASKLCSSKTEARNLLDQNGIKCNGEIVKEGFIVPKNSILQKGKRHFMKII